MPEYSDKSVRKLAECDDRLKDLFYEVIKHFDHTVLCGMRDQRTQNELFEKGYSKLKFPRSKHNQTPSHAVDVAPWPIDWNDLDRWFYFGGFVMGIAAMKGIKLRWGGDWDRDTDLKDNRFDDLGHFELDE